MSERRTRISKFLSYVLRHHPGELGLQLQEGGWASVGRLLAAARRRGRDISRAELEQMVAEDPKGRFSLSEDGSRIRANYGHSVEVELGLEPSEPPEVLYHGTARRFLDAIRREGLRPRGRQWVHLSPDEHSASRVGARHGRAVVLRVEAGRMHAEGHELRYTSSGIWLTERVPPEYIDFP